MLWVMRALFAYFRRHRWQRRLLSCLLAMVLGGAAALLALPYVQAWLLLRDLASDDPAVRAAAVNLGIARGRESEYTVRRLDDALDEAGDVQFAAIISVLKWLGRFNTPDRPTRHVDRLRALELTSNPSAPTRWLFLREMILSGRDNAHVRRGLAAASADASPAVRGLSALLAASLGDDAALKALLADGDPNVAAAAALDVGVARRRGHAAALAGLLRSAGDLERLSAAAYGLARTDPNGSADLLLSALDGADRAGDAALRDRMLHVMAERGGREAGAAVLGVLERSSKAGAGAPAAAIVAAGRLRLATAGPHVRRVLARAIEPDGQVTIGQLIAAIDAADALDLPVRREVYDVCDRLWTRRVGYRLMLMKAARLLGRQARRTPPEPSPTEADCTKTLLLAAFKSYLTEAPPATGRSADLTTPMPSAGAAVALWELGSPLAGDAIAHVAGQETTLPGDYVSWHVGLRGGERAFELGLEMLPPLGGDPNTRVYNDSLRSAGAMLLAVAARTPQRRRIAARRVRSRLAGGQLGGEDAYHVRGAYQCALAALGEADQLGEALALLETGQFSQRRAITALTVAGSLAGLDWLLWNPQVADDDALFLLVDEQIGEVLAACAAELPGVDDSAGDDLASWQLRILRDAYAIARGRIRPRLPAPTSVPASAPAAP